jgi:hypothetical protein
MKSKNTSKTKLFPFIVVVLVIIVGLSLVSFYLKTTVVSRQVTNISKKTKPDSSSTPSITSHVTIPSDYKTYTNNKIGYSFAYPEEWGRDIQNEPDDYTFISQTLLNYSTVNIEQYMNHGEIDWDNAVGDKVILKFDIFVTPLNQTPEQYIETKIKGETDAIISRRGSIDTNEIPYQVAPIMTIGTFKTYQVTIPVTNHFNKHIASELFYAFSKNKVANIYLSIYNTDSIETAMKSEDWKTVENIFRSFHFL